jgi:hypothetical protein
MVVNQQFHCPAALIVGKESGLNFEYECEVYMDRTIF